MTEERAVLAGGCFFGEKLSDLGMGSVLDVEMATLDKQSKGIAIHK
jgi:hypothetical protein